MTTQELGFIGTGRLGVALAGKLLDAGHTVYLTKRGKSQSLLGKGAIIAGSGTAADVAAAAPVIFTCLPSEASLDEVINGPDGILSAQGDAPLVVELSTLSVDAMARANKVLATRGGSLLDAPVSGTPVMAEAGTAVIFGSGDKAAWDSISGPVQAMSASAVYCGALGSGTKMKYIANTLVFIHLSAAAEAIAFAGRIGLDPALVAEILSNARGAMSGQFAIRGPIMAQGQVSDMATVDMTVKDLKLITEYGAEARVDIPLLHTVDKLFDALVDRGEGQTGPEILAKYLAQGGLLDRTCG